MSWLKQFVDLGGPSPSRAVAFTAWVAELQGLIQTGTVNRDEWNCEWKAFTMRCLNETMGARALLKPHGYAGDFEIIDAIYHSRVSEDPGQKNWDTYFHAQAAPTAVRNRKIYFQRTITNAVVSAACFDEEMPRILNIASGPGRDMHEWLCANPGLPMLFDCVELDPNAIAFASNLCAQHADRVRFHRANALRFRPQDMYHLAWSSGLFDYLNDSLFVRVLKSLLNHVLPGGEVVIGNFGSYNPSRAYMELLGDWNLIHRSPEHLRELALAAGGDEKNIRIGREPACVNLFLHVSKPSRSS